MFPYNEVAICKRKDDEPGRTDISIFRKVSDCCGEKTLNLSDIGGTEVPDNYYNAKF